MSWFSRINSLALALCFVVVVFGAFVRLSDAGLGCPDWPGCYGHLVVPEAPHAVAAADQHYPLRPVQAPKAWKEMIHRYLATTLGLLIVALAFLSAVLRRQNLPRVLPWVLVALVVLQGMLGMWTVTWQLKPLVVSGHLLGGMTTLSLLLWMRLSLNYRRQSAALDAAPAREPRNEREAWSAVQLSPPETTLAASPQLRLFAGIALVVLACQIFLGGWTSSNYASLACPDFPTCQGQWWPQTDIKEAFTLWRGLGINYEYGVLDARARVTIHLFHRLGALTVTAILLLLGITLLRKQEALWRRLGIAVLAALALQVAIGISIVKLQLPLFLADMHNAGAAVLLLVMVSLNFFTWNARK
ncbi:MAG: COX15/CtaA family protein [Stenotrophobium sp.]